MHSYATDAIDRTRAPIFLALIAVILAWVIANYVPSLLWWFDTPSVIGFYGLLYAWYNRWGWRNFSAIPNLEGTWVGDGTSTYERKDGSNDTKFVIHIRQTWRNIRIDLETTHSRSRSLMGALNTHESAEHGLHYEYLNEPKAHAPKTMVSFRGVAHLRVSGDHRELDGDYYTGRGREERGSMKLMKISDKFVSFEEAVKL